MMDYLLISLIFNLFSIDLKMKLKIFVNLKIQFCMFVEVTCLLKENTLNVNDSWEFHVLDFKLMQ